MCQQDAIFLKPGDFKWWLFLDTWVGELRSGSRYSQYVAMVPEVAAQGSTAAALLRLQQILTCRSIRIFWPA